MFRTIKNFFSRSKEPSNAFIQFRPRKGMTFQKWKDSPHLITEFREFWKRPIWHDAMTVLVNAQPTGSTRSGLSPTEVALDLGRAQGHAQCIELLHSLSDFPSDKPPEVEMDYGAEDILRESGYAEEKQ